MEPLDRRALGIALVAAILGTSIAAHAQDLAAWQKDREAKFAAFRAAHPSQDAEIADIKAKTAASIAGHAPPPTPPKYADLKARSAALTPEQKAQAQNLFSIGFGLWKSGDFAAAKDAFSQGLAIDPGNGSANFYWGDIASRVGAAGEARVAFQKVLELAPGTSEWFKAGVELRALPADPNDPAVNSPPIIWRTSEIPVQIWDDVAAPQMVVIPAGEYTMGSSTTEEGHQDQEGPLHRVRIGYALAVSQYQITYGEFARFVAETNYNTGNSCYKVPLDALHNVNNWRSPGFPQTANNPATCINYSDAVAYADWLSRKTGSRYRLLSEAEYEYAMRAGTSTIFWWGDDANASCAYANGADLDTHARFSDAIGDQCHDGYVFTSPVGSFKPNAFGLYDMTGNVWDWTSDCWNQSYQRAPSDGSAQMTGMCGSRVIRGGDWGSDSSHQRSANRMWVDAGGRGDYLGFRLARVL